MEMGDWVKTKDDKINAALNQKHIKWTEESSQSPATHSSLPVKTVISALPMLTRYSPGRNFQFLHCIQAVTA